MKGPTICRRAEGSALRTLKPPRSRTRGTMTISRALQERRSPKTGSSEGSQLMKALQNVRADCNYRGWRLRLQCFVHRGAAALCSQPVPKRNVNTIGSNRLTSLFHFRSRPCAQLPADDLSRGG